MNRIYRCPVCTKASYSYGTCSDECESKLPEMFEKENALPDGATCIVKASDTKNRRN